MEAKSVSVVLVPCLIALGAWLYANPDVLHTASSKVEAIPTLATVAPGTAGSVTATFFRNGGNNTAETDNNGVTVTFMRNEPSDTVAGAMAHQVGIRLAVPSAIFTGQGEEVKDFSAIPDYSLLYVLPQGEHWFWPGVQVGHKTTIKGLRNHLGNEMVLETLALSPRVFFIDEFMTDAEAEAIIEASKPHMERSGVYGGVKESSKVSDVRTSQQAWLLDSDEISKVMTRRVEELTKVPGYLGERIQVVHYGPDQHYHAHHDYFDPKLYPDREDLQKGRNRMITVLFYLNDVPAGGHTAFPRAGPTGYGMGPIYDYGDCSRGVAVEPKKRGAVMFYSLAADGHMHGALDEMSLHGGCDVKVGEKWAANKWVYNMQE